MSVVWRARREGETADCAIKLLSEPLADDPSARARFEREAQAVARLSHPGIVQILEYCGPEAGPSYIVTERIDGPTLKAWVEAHGAPPYPELAAAIVERLADALAHAHEAGVIHRDIKPDNIMITAGGALKLLDFGIASLQAELPRLTQTGTMLGSPAHMSPEAIDGAEIDARSDVFSLGTLLYWLCTGELPFSAPNPSALFHRILEGQYEPPQLLQPRLGNGLARVIERALSPAPAERYASMRELQSALRTQIERLGLLGEALPRYLLDPEGFLPAWREALLTRLLREARRAIRGGHTARATDRINRVLAIDPENPEGLALLEELQRPPSKRRLFLWLGLLAGLTAGAMLWAFSPGAETPAVPEPKEAPPAARTQAPSVPTAAPDAGQAPDAAAPPSVAEIADKPRPRPAPPKRARPSKKKTAPPPASPAPEDAGTQTPAQPDASATPPEPKAEPAVVATLHVRIGPAWANIRLDGAVVKRYAYRAALRLSAGQHNLQVEAPHGRSRVHRIEVATDGSIVELLPGGRRQALGGGELRFSVPHPSETKPSPDWEPSSR